MKTLKIQNKLFDNIKKERGITLVALIITIIILIILLAVSIKGIFGQEGIINKVLVSIGEYKFEQAREVLMITLESAKLNKAVNQEYNQDEFLNEFILKEIPNSKIRGGIVIVDGHAFEINRNIPEIGKYLGRESDLTFPDLKVNTEFAEDNKIAKITMTAKEEKNGISKIEIWQGGNIIKEYTYKDEKSEIEEEYIAKQNGTYTIKVYAGITTWEIVKIEGIVVSVEYSPNGNKTYAKEHEVKVTVRETEEKLKNMKYQWLNTTEEPTKESFTENCNNGELITGKGYTGTYYLWNLVEFESGKTNICRSEGFNFDNEGPNITEFKVEKYSLTGVTLSATAQDTGFGTVKFEFYVDDELKDTQECEVTTLPVTKSITVNDITTGTHNCKVIVYDEKEYASNKTESGTTKLYAWTKWNCSENVTWEKVIR